MYKRYMTTTLITKTPHKMDVWLADKGWSRADLARELDVVTRTVDRWANGSHFPDCQNIQRIYVMSDAYVELMDWETAFVIKRRAAMARPVARAAGEKPKRGPAKRRPRTGKPAGKMPAGKTSTGRKRTRDRRPSTP